ncbi:hypothetical protein, partial [Bacillus licheniformis]|uniref:hypothetical protein n=1 Tax=Bacillus licheniformis TaxID=1402 RepID=UPI00237CA7DD
GWVRVSRSGAAKQGALLREREIQELRLCIDALQEREAGLETRLSGLREPLPAAEQQRGEAPRQLYAAHRGVSELAGQLQSQQGQLEAARETRTQTRALLADLAVSDDTRAQGLAREIAGLGFTPATQPPGWRQKAVDVSDQLNTLDAADPHLQQVAAKLARAGFG